MLTSIRRAAMGILIVVLAAGLVGCNGRDELLVRAVFDDIVDLVPRGHVKIADVPVGVIADVELTDDYKALVSMRITEPVELPARVTARLRKTNVLGERFVELVPDAAGGGRFDPDRVITDTEVVGELEALVAAGSEALAAVAADRLAAALQANAEGLGGRGATFDRLLDDLTGIVRAYDANSEDLVRLIEGFEAFVAAAGPEADTHGRALEELRRATAVLAAEDERLLDTLGDVRSLAHSGTDIMVTHRERIDSFFRRFAAISGELAGRQRDLADFGRFWHMHNHNTIRGVNAEHAQVVLDFIVCGVNDTPGDPVRSCRQPPSGRPIPAPGEPQP